MHFSNHFREAITALCFDRIDFVVIPGKIHQFVFRLKGVSDDGCVTQGISILSITNFIILCFWRYNYFLFFSLLRNYSTFIFTVEGNNFHSILSLPLAQQFHSCNLGQKVCRIFRGLVQFLFTASETEVDYNFRKICEMLGFDGQYPAGYPRS